MERLIVKNFGPLKDVDIELNKINLFIGENGSGKSVLAKIITIVKDYSLFHKSIVFKKLKDFNIDNFLKKDSIIGFYINEKIIFELQNEKIKFSSIHKVYQENILTKNQLELTFNTKLPSLEQNEKVSKYIPAERNLISLFNKSLTTLLVAEVPLPKFLLAFSSEFEKAGNELKELEFLNVKYVNGDGLDRHKIYFNNEDYLSLEHSSSGIQSALPLYLTIKYFSSRYGSILIEEPEQNLFPKAQAETIKYTIEQISNRNNLFMMTHSPYVLSTLNNLLYAHIVAKLGESEKKEVKELIDERQWINPNNFSAYYLENGVARSIKSDIGLINNNEIDDISEEMGEEFDELLEIYRASKND